jgi:hypothetical protein
MASPVPPVNLPQISTSPILPSPSDIELVIVFSTAIILPPLPLPLVGGGQFTYPVGQ